MSTAQQAEEKEQTELSQPYCHFVSYALEQKMQKLKAMKQHDHHNLMAPLIVEDQACFVTKAFLIRYCEEEVEVNDVVLFRAELDVEPDYLATEFYLDFDLYFSDLSNLGGPEKWQEHVHDIQ